VFVIRKRFDVSGMGKLLFARVLAHPSTGERDWPMPPGRFERMRGHRMGRSPCARPVGRPKKTAKKANRINGDKQNRKASGKEL